VEYCVWGWDNLPRTLLMYYTNFVSSPEGYFQTVLCNAPRFVSTVANHDLHHIQWDTPEKMHSYLKLVLWIRSIFSEQQRRRSQKSCILTMVTIQDAVLQ
jgi:hypothetical protein